MGHGTFKPLIKRSFLSFYKINSFIKVVKPGIIVGNVITLISGFFLASQGNLQSHLLFNTIISIIFIIASACIMNNILDKDIDLRMSRTNQRILCLWGDNHYLISFFWFFSFFLLILGCTIFYLYVNFLCVLLSLIGVFFYVFLYSYLFKRKYVYSTGIGSISGALPPIIGYVAVKNDVDFCCLILFFIFSIWQIAHAYSISIFRLKDYKTAEIPLFSVIYGIEKTKTNINYCIVFLIFLNFLFYWSGYVYIIYFIYTTIFLFFWYFFSFFGVYFLNSKIWSRFMFFISLVVIFVISFFMSLNFYFN
ncbi:heme o synthase [Buchnera aphidicola]|uniref:heme o synthase n=1 Tax=Buchnera aphidicola TaxID=9 RepID=UPI0009E62D5D|nr:heme o synthase [Buchnera aphidicola]